VQLTQQSEDVVKQKFRPDQLESKLAWRDGMLLFEGDPLEKVVREVSRYTAIRIDVDASVRDIEVLGYFRTGDIDGILLTMRDTFGVKVERLSEDHIVLKADN
jgi:transmembrane sensor